jgi:hypothetical protein
MYGPLDDNSSTLLTPSPQHMPQPPVPFASSYHPYVLRVIKEFDCTELLSIYGQRFMEGAQNGVVGGHEESIAALGRVKTSYVP